MTKVALLDGDVIAYQACSVASSSSPAVQWEDDEPATDDPGKACDMADDKVYEWMKFAGADECIIALSGESELNFRRALNPEYKQNRTGEKPPWYYEVLEHMRSEWLCVSEPPLEGDDILGLLLTVSNNAVVVSTDKDIFTLPGAVLRVPHSLKKDVAWGAVENSEEAADRYWMTQVITGDAVDGYRGCPGAGPKAAETALEGIRTLPRMWQKVLEVYRRYAQHDKWGPKFVHQGRPETEALMNARCARILRDGDYSFEEERVKLWNP